MKRRAIAEAIPKTRTGSINPIPGQKRI